MKKCENNLFDKKNNTTSKENDINKNCSIINTKLKNIIFLLIVVIVIITVRNK